MGICCEAAGGALLQAAVKLQQAGMAYRRWCWTGCCCLRCTVPPVTKHLTTLRNLQTTTQRKGVVGAESAAVVYRAHLPSVGRSMLGSLCAQALRYSST